MLNVFFEDPHTLPRIENVEFAFSERKISFNDIDKKIVKTVERGELVDDKVFLDRFGYHLYLSEMSTGCKAGIITNHFPNYLVSLHECGINAKSAIIAFCKSGNILLEYPECGFIDYTEGETIDVSLEDHRFTRMSDLMYYISDGRLMEHCH